MSHQCPTCLEILSPGQECQQCKIKGLEVRLAELEIALVEIADLDHDEWYEAHLIAQKVLNRP